MIEKILINLIESLDRIMDTWEHLTLRRTLLTSFTLILFIQTIITTILWIMGKEISNTWLGIMTIEYTAFGTMLSWYFSNRNKEGENGNRPVRKDYRKLEK